ncbi:MAG: bifunctional riboflavin kinase/FAD synthetase [Geminicoccaceae bacterium]
MRVHRRFASLPAGAGGAAVAIGNFDGVHRGHRRVIEAAAATARHLGAPLGVVTFEPHPREVVNPGLIVPRLTGFARKAELFEALGVEELFVLPFDRAMMQLGAEAFAAEILIGRLGLRAIAAGENFRFGHGRSGDVRTLARLAARLGYAFEAVPGLEDDGPVSSSRIRDLLAAGEIATVNRLLGYPYAIDGIVRPGDRRGRTLGFPTANVHPLDQRLVLPAIGVYAVRVGRGRGSRMTWHPGVANLGRRPTFDGRSLLLEVHLLEGGRDLYGERLRVTFVERLRGERKFAGIDELKAQIERDCLSARHSLAA